MQGKENYKSEGEDLGQVEEKKNVNTSLSR